MVILDYVLKKKTHQLQDSTKRLHFKTATKPSESMDRFLKSSSLRIDDDSIFKSVFLRMND